MPFIQKTRRLSIIWLCLLVIAVFSVNCYINTETTENYNKKYLGANNNLTATFCDYPEKGEDYYKYLLKTDDENGVKFFLYSDMYIEIKPGYKIKADFKFDNKTVDLADGVYFTTSIYEGQKYNINENGHSFCFEDIRHYFKSVISDNMIDGSGLANAILFADKSEIGDNTYRSLKFCGLLHVTATSGLHLSIITGFLFIILSGFGISKRKISVFSIVIIVLFVMIEGFRFSIVRAAIMLIFVYAADLFKRESDPVNSMGAAMTVITLVSPFSAIDCGFLMSLCATFGMIEVFSNFGNQFGNIKAGAFAKTGKILLSAFLGSVVATVFTLPISYIFFGYFSAIAPLANMLLIPYITIILVLSVVLLLLSPTPYLPPIIGYINDVFSRVVINVSNYLSKWKYCIVNIDAESFAVAFLLVSFFISVCILLYYFCFHKKFRLICIATILSAVTFCSFYAVDKIACNDTYNLYFPKTTGGMCAILTKNKSAVLIGAGGRFAKSSVQSFLDNKGITDIKMMIIPDEKQINMLYAKQSAYLFKPEYVIMNINDDGYYEISSISEKSKFVNSNKAHSFSFGKAKIDIVPSGETSVVFVSCNKNTILLSDKYASLNSLDERYLNPDYFYINNAEPENIDLVGKKTKYIYSKALKNYGIDIAFGEKVEIRKEN